jgi:hypothetical protein
MAFVHGKHSVFLLRDSTNVWRDMTPFLNEVTLPTKAGTAETTVFGRGAKTYISGLLEGQMTMKGFYDPNTVAGSGDSSPYLGSDYILAGLLGQQPAIGLTVVAQVAAQSNYGQFILIPAGSLTGATCSFGDIVMTDYNTSDPVTGVVSFTASFQLSGAPVTAASPTPHLTFASANQTAYQASLYGLQILRAPAANMFTAGWLVGGTANTIATIPISSGGAASVVTTTTAHGLSVGQVVTIVITTDFTTPEVPTIAGTWVVLSVPSSTSLTLGAVTNTGIVPYVVTTGGTGGSQSIAITPNAGVTPNYGALVGTTS